MVSRRQFLKTMGLTLVAGTPGWSVPPQTLAARPTFAAGPAVKIALLADAHLPEASDNTAAARNLLAAVAEIKAQEPPVDLLFWLGDLSDNGQAGALGLGKEILASVPAPCWFLPGEKDYLGGSLWATTFGDATFSFSHQGWHFIGIDTTAAHPATGQKYFHFSPGLQDWLTRELQQIPLAVPLLIFSHGPLYRLFQPWHWWTEEVERLYELLSGREKVFLCNGHVHQNITLRHRNLIFQGVRATAWSGPDVRVGCLAEPPPPPGIKGRQGCGWLLLTANSFGDLIIADKVWQS